MSKVFIEEESLTAIGNAIREKTGDTAPLSVPTGMVNAISNISGGGGVDINLLKRVTSSKKVGSSSDSERSINISITIPKNAVFGIITMAARLFKSPSSGTYGKVYTGSACFIIQNNKIILYSEPLYKSNYINDEEPTFFSFTNSNVSGVSTVTLPAVSSDNTYHLSLSVYGRRGSDYYYIGQSYIPEDLYITSFVTE